MNRVLILLLAALLVAIGVWALSQTAWAAAFANGIITGNQAHMDAAYAAAAGDGQTPVARSGYTATFSNLVRMAGFASLVIGGSLLNERRKKRRPRSA
jgi:hypothetical protein